jgi:hypothetical protein
MITRTLAGTSVIVLLSFCSSTPASNKNRPLLKQLKTWPDSLVIETFYYGGMMPASDRLSIRKDSCIVETQRNQIKNHYAFVPKQEDLDKLLAELNNYSIDKQHAEKTGGIMYDAPTTGISIQLGRQFISISNSATERIAEKNKGDFRACVDLLNGWSAKALAGKKKNLCFSIDNSVRNSKGKLSIIPEGDGNSYYDYAANIKDTFCLQLLPGKHGFQIHITELDKNYNTKYIASLYPVVDLREDQHLKLTRVNDSTLELK